MDGLAILIFSPAEALLEYDDLESLPAGLVDFEKVPRNSTRGRDEDVQEIPYFTQSDFRNPIMTESIKSQSLELEESHDHRPVGVDSAFIQKI